MWLHQKYENDLQNKLVTKEFLSKFCEPEDMTKLYLDVCYLINKDILIIFVLYLNILYVKINYVTRRITV